jgi:excisionase family DNA binding protein
MQRVAPQQLELDVEPPEAPDIAGERGSAGGGPAEHTTAPAPVAAIRLDPLLTAREVGERLGLSTATVLDWFEAERLPGFRLGGRVGGPVRFRENDVLGLLESWRVGSPPAAGRPVETSRSAEVGRDA